MSEKIKVLQLGLGFIGQSIHDILKQRSDLYEVVGAVDPDPSKANSLAGTKVSASVDEALQGTRADVAVLATTSRMDTITPQVLDLVERGIHVVSTCEELVYPWTTNPDESARIDEAARKNGVAVLSTGVNPGFLMDFLPTVVSRIAVSVDRVVVERSQDAKPRREAFQRKVGAGMTTDEFAAAVKRGNFGHAGLTASVQLLAAGMGWELDSSSETIEPVMAKERMVTEFLTVEPGHVAGVYQVGSGMRNGKEIIRLIFTAAVGQPESFDKIQILGSPDLEMIFPNGVHGDTATGAITVNTIPVVGHLAAGLHTMADLWPAG